MRRKPKPPVTGFDSDERLWLNGKIVSRRDKVIFTLDGKSEIVEIEDIYIDRITVNSEQIVSIIAIELSNRYILESIEEVKEMLSWK